MSKDRAISFPRLLSLTGWVAIASLAVVPRTVAQDVFPPNNVAEAGQTFETEVCFLKSASIENGSGKVEVSSLDAMWSWSFLSLEYQGKFYNWQSPAANPFSPAHEPVWNTLHTTWLTAGYSNSITRHLHYSAEADVFVSFEREHFGLVGNDADGALFYSFPHDWYIYGGMAVHHSPFQTDLYPLLGVSHGVESNLGWSFTVGTPDTKIKYRFSTRYSLDAGYSIFNVDYYLLAVDEVEDHDRYLETSDNRLSMVFNMEPRRNLCMGIGVQYTVDNELLFYSANQQNRTSYRMSSVPGLLLKLQYRF